MVQGPAPALAGRSKRSGLEKPVEEEQQNWKALIRPAPLLSFPTPGGPVLAAPPLAATRERRPTLRLHAALLESQAQRTSGRALETFPKLSRSPNELCSHFRKCISYNLKASRISKPPPNASPGPTCCRVTIKGREPVRTTAARPQPPPEKKEDEANRPRALALPKLKRFQRGLSQRPRCGTVRIEKDN